MDRLTMWDEEEKRWRMKPGYLMSQQVIKRLAAYEDTGLEPGELVEMQNEAYDLGYQSCLRYKGLTWNEAEELQRYRKAEAEGRLLALPCKVGDTVYKLWYAPCHNGEEMPDSYGCSGCMDECDIHKEVFEKKVPSLNFIVEYFLNDKSMVYFLTREEAEAALKGGSNEAD